MARRTDCETDASSPSAEVKWLSAWLWVSGGYSRPVRRGGEGSLFSVLIHTSMMVCVWRGMYVSVCGGGRGDADLKRRMSSEAATFKRKWKEVMMAHDVSHVTGGGHHTFPAVGTILSRDWIRF